MSNNFDDNDSKNLNFNNEIYNPNECYEVYSEKNLFEKIKDIAKKAGVSVIYCVLLLYYVLQNENVPMKIKAQIIISLGYFILPVDMIPDFIIGVGYSDDLTMLINGLRIACKYVDDTVIVNAQNKLREWFENYNVEDLEFINKIFEEK